DEDAVALRLAVEARTPRTEDDRHARTPCVRKQVGDLARFAGEHHRLWKEAIRARVRCVANEVESAGKDPVLAEQLDQLPAQRLRCAARDAVGRAIGGGLRYLRRDSLHPWLEQRHWIQT